MSKINDVQRELNNLADTMEARYSEGFYGDNHYPLGYIAGLRKAIALLDKATMTREERKAWESKE